MGVGVGGGGGVGSGVGGVGAGAGGVGEGVGEGTGPEGFAKAVQPVVCTMSMPFSKYTFMAPVASAASLIVKPTHSDKPAQWTLASSIVMVCLSICWLL